MTVTVVLLTVAVTVTAAPAGSTDRCPVRCVSCVDGVADCSKRSLVTPPKDFQAATTRKVILDNNHLRVLGTNSFQNLQHVEVLRLKGNTTPWTPLTTLYLQP